MKPVAGGTFLEFLHRACEFMERKIDSRQAEKIKAFRQMALYAAITGEVVVTLKGGAQRSITKFSALRALFKKELYRYAKLVPRPSDVDYAEMLLLDLNPYKPVKDSRHARCRCAFKRIKPPFFVCCQLPLARARFVTTRAASRLSLSLHRMRRQRLTPMRWLPRSCPWQTMCPTSLPLCFPWHRSPQRSRGSAQTQWLLS